MSPDGGLIPDLIAVSTFSKKGHLKGPLWNFVSPSDVIRLLTPFVSQDFAPNYSFSVCLRPPYSASQNLSHLGCLGGTDG